MKSTRTCVRWLLATVLGAFLVMTWAPRADAHVGGNAQLFFASYRFVPAGSGFTISAHMVDADTGIGAVGFGAIATLTPCQPTTGRASTVCTPASGGVIGPVTLTEQGNGYYSGSITASPGKYKLALSGQQVRGGPSAIPDNQSFPVTLTDKGQLSGAGGSSGGSSIGTILLLIVVVFLIIAAVVGYRRRSARIDEKEAELERAGGRPHRRPAGAPAHPGAHRPRPAGARPRPSGARPRTAQAGGSRPRPAEAHASDGNGVSDERAELERLRQLSHRKS